MCQSQVSEVMHRLHSVICARSTPFDFRMMSKSPHSSRRLGEKSEAWSRCVKKRRGLETATQAYSGEGVRSADVQRSVRSVETQSRAH